MIATRNVRRATGAASALLLAAMGLGGCASQQSHDQLSDVNRSLKERNEELLRSNQEMQMELGQIQKHRNANEAALAALQQQNSALKRQLSDMGIAFKEFDARLGGLAFGSLDPQTDLALRDLASQYPDIIKYDSARGMLRFASDLTFASGHDTVQESAKASLAALAKILTGGSAMNYEIMVMGHTDSQPIKAAVTRGHPTNVHLSTHRAIAVRQVLSSLGVPADKVWVAGWGEFRPVVANAANGNTPANRRVEIYLTRPSNAMESEGGLTPKPTVSHETPSRQPDLTK
ncbi:MAG: OmpA family protein [Phycisphaerales bacterium]